MGPTVEMEEMRLPLQGDSAILPSFDNLKPDSLTSEPMLSDMPNCLLLRTDDLVSI